MPGEIEDNAYRKSAQSGLVDVLPENLKMVNDVALDLGIEPIGEITK